MKITFKQQKIDTAGMECEDRVWAIYCPELSAWIKTWGNKKLVFTEDPKQIDKNARRNTSTQLSKLACSKADKWRLMVQNNQYSIDIPNKEPRP